MYIKFAVRALDISNHLINGGLNALFIIFKIPQRPPIQRVQNRILRDHEDPFL